MKKVLLSVVLALMLAISLIGLRVDVASADDGKIGMKVALSDGSEATCIGKDGKGNYIWQARIGEPIYIPGTVTKYDTTWHGAGDNYTAGANSFTARVDGNTVRVWYTDQASTWTPRLDIGKAEVKSSKPTLLAVDPVNANYRNNTLMWDYGNGVRRYVRIIEGMLLEYYIIDKEQPDTLAIAPNLSKSEGFVWHRETVAFDADKKIVNLGKTTDSLSMTKAITTKEGTTAKYPITIDPDTSFTTSASDGVVRGGYSANFTTVWTATTADYKWDATTGLYVGQQYLSAQYAVWRDGLYFDTSALSGYSVTDASLHLFWVENSSVTDFAVTITNGQPTYPHDPLELGDYNKANYAVTDGGNVNTSTFSGATGWATITLNATGLTWIDTAGDTKLFLRSSRDIAGTTPTGNEYVVFASYEYGASYRPYLDVTYTAEAPSGTMNAASNVAVTSARLNATVDDDGGTGCQVRWGYGTTTQTSGNFTSYDTVTSWSTDNYTTGEHPYEDIASLTGGDTYYARVQIKNTAGNVTSDEISFTTESSLNPPTGVIGYPSETSITLSWSKSSGADSTVIRFSLAAFPTDNTTGTLVYSGADTTYEHDSLNSGQTYFYSLWGTSGDNWSASYTTYAMTTNAFTLGSGDDLEPPSMWSRWFSPPDYTNLSQLEPVYSTVNGVADSLGMPRNIAWQGMIVFGIVILTALVLATTKQVAAAFIVALAGLGIGAAMHILPTLWFGFTLFAAIAALILKGKMHAAGE